MNDDVFNEFTNSNVGAIFMLQDMNNHDKKIDKNQLIDNKKAKSRILTLIDLMWCCFFITPVAVLFLASSWNIIEDYLDFGFILNNVFMFVLCNFILICAYLSQYELQNLHNKIMARPNLDLNADIVINRIDYYGWGFLLRCIYTYVLTLSYILQWKCYWEVYDQITNDTSYYYFVFISILCIFIYRLLGQSLASFTQTTPFFLVKDLEFSEYFLQAKIIKLNNRVNFLKIYFILTSF